jgi:predicted nuclease with TOPRIM domain
VRIQQQLHDILKQNNLMTEENNEKLSEELEGLKADLKKEASRMKMLEMEKGELEADLSKSTAKVDVLVSEVEMWKTEVCGTQRHHNTQLQKFKKSLVRAHAFFSSVGAQGMNSPAG